MTQRRSRDAPVTEALGPGVTFLARQDRRLVSTHLRVTWLRAVADEAAATAVLARTLEAASTRWPTRRALAERLGDLYGASLSCGVERIGNGAGLVASLAWPTGQRGQASDALASGFDLLGDVLLHPVRGAPGALSLHEELVDVARRNQLRALQALHDDKARRAVRGLLRLSCAGEPYGAALWGDARGLREVSADQLGRLHARLARQAPCVITAIGPAPVARMRRLAIQHLLNAQRAPRKRIAGTRPVVRAASERVRRGVTRDHVGQAQLALAWRGAIRPSTKRAWAGHALSGVLGESGASLLFRHVREEQGLCYAIGSFWLPTAGLLGIHAGVDPNKTGQTSRAVARVIQRVVRSGPVPDTWAAWRAETAERFATLRDKPSGLMRFWTHRHLVGAPTDPATVRAQLLALQPKQVQSVASQLGRDAVFALRPMRNAGGVA